MAWERELEVARRAARVAGENALEAQRSGFTAESKADESPVTTADKGNERIIAGLLTEAFPDDGLLGEEGAARDGSSGRRWIIDPIDGTRDFIRGLPAWCVMIGLEEAGETALGVIHFPVLGWTYWAARGAGAFRNGEPIRVAGRNRWSEAMLCANGLKFLSGTALDRPDLAAWWAASWGVRCFGGALDAMLVASGEVDAYVEPHVKPWDLAAMKAIVEEAGARFFSFAGRATIYDGNCVVCTPGLEDEIQRFLGVAAS